MRLMQLIFLRRLLPKEWRTGLLRPWNSLLNWEQFRVERGFYRKFVREDDLVFDIGANTGIKTRAFLSLGARVIAIEPNPACADKIRRCNQRAITDGRLHAEEIAVAAIRSKITLNVFKDDPTITSGSDAFVDAAADDGLVSTSTIEVKTLTADDLVLRYGCPAFIKVDVEGMDAEVLRGLHHRPRFLSFEFNTKSRLWNNALDCLKEAKRIGFAEANLTGSGLPRLLLESWVGLDKVPNEIHHWAQGRQTFGDVILR